MNIILVSNDVVPGMGMPVSAPGLRTAGIASGLRAQGFDVTVTVPRHRVGHAGGDLKSLTPAPANTQILNYKHLRGFISAQKPDATIICNSTNFPSVDGSDHGFLVYDFFAPRYLEAICANEPEDELERIRERKLRALKSADAVVSNGRKKIAYIEEWLERAGRTKGEVPVSVLNMCYPWPSPAQDGASTEARPRFILSGYFQKWLQYGSTFEQISRFIDDQPDVEFTFLLPRLSASDMDAVPGLRACMDRNSVNISSPMLFQDYADMLQAHDVFIDVFSRTEERELAMVTRSVNALGCGLPVVHMDFTEVSLLIRDYDAGWEMSDLSGNELSGILQAIVSDPDLLRAKKQGALALSREQLQPKPAVASLAKLLRSL